MVIELLNTVLALFVAYRALAAANKMNRFTCHWIRAAVVLIAIGSVGIAVAPLFGRQHGWIVTAFLAGIIAYLHVDRRRTV